MGKTVLINSKIYTNLVIEKIKQVLKFKDSVLTEKSIDVGSSLKDKLDSIGDGFSERILKFLSSDNIDDKSPITKVDLEPDDKKTFTATYQTQRGDKKQKVKILKLIKLLGGDVSQIKGYEIENLIKYLKAGDDDGSEGNFNLKVIEGDDIADAYYCENYYEVEDKTRGNLYVSCMRHGDDYFDIYTENPESVKMLVLYKDNKVFGRALLWKTNGGKYMDRIYIADSNYEKYFINYAQKNNFVLYPKSPQGDVELENGGEYESYPYLDTFKYYSPDIGVLSTEDGDLILQDTGGGYIQGLYSEYHNEHIPEDEAVYLDYMRDYVREEDVVSTIDGGYVLTDDAEELHNGYYVHKDEAIYADYIDEYIHRDEAVELHDETYATEEDAIELYDGEYALESEIVQLHDGEYALKDDEDIVQTYDDEWALKDEVEVIPSGEYEGQYRLID